VLVKVLITGASGFVGSNLARKIHKTREYDISVFVRKETDLWRIRDLLPNLNLHFIDITDAYEIKKKIEKIKPEIVYHCATYGVYSSQKNMDKMVETNIVGSMRLLQALENAKYLKKFINVGSFFEYGPKQGSVKESDIAQPMTPYSITKLTQTILTRYFYLQKNLPTITLRIFTAYGMYEETGRLITDIMLATLRNKTLNISSLKPKRDFIFIDDVVNALLNASKVSTTGEVINIGSGKSHSVNQIIKIISKITNTDLKINYGQNPHEFDKMINNGYADMRKAKKMLSWSPFYSIEDGLSKTYDWYKENIQLYESL